MSDDPQTTLTSLGYKYHVQAGRYDAFAYNGIQLDLLVRDMISRGILPSITIARSKEDTRERPA